VGGEASDREIVSTRTLDVPREQVFAAFADPARLARWWGPKGFTSTVHAYDFRPGGAWRSTLHGPDGVDYPNESQFVEIAAPGRIVFRHLSREHPYEMEITLEPQGGGTRMTWRMSHPTASACARVRPFVVEGNEQNFDRLAAELARVGAPGGATGAR
jgi:uncharacterized protein YndB with AHSA1/START domain